ncbi:M23 family metallopeptidase [Geotoga petraea]|uniref:M23 family metallopeptidase n=1 Tax=Geotoga petraea TaxID=28234 RepID=A0A1G6K940_9BACT|nr:M23 family metallopeptidase [Geotoga petraea]TGG88447.1 M23 family metallopeptidase [Geotoga petraea]SDC26826.1 Peptidase family M23 [Geotoga petraea]
MKKLSILLMMLFFITTIFSAIFEPPIKNSYITSSFGEYRGTGNNPHYHLGIDFSTFYRENVDVYSASQGYLKKVWINDPIYGNALFVNHPDSNLTTVYAHLNEFNDSIMKYVDLVKEDFQGSTGRIEIVFPENEFQIKSGEIIAYSGSTGEALAPHLHFEVREQTAAGEVVLDALEFINYKEERTKILELLEVRNSTGNYTINQNGETIVEFTGSYPKIDVRVREKLGQNSTILPKKVSLFIDGNLVYKVSFSKVYFENAYNPSPIYGYGSTSTIYWLKMYSDNNENLIITDNNLSRYINSNFAEYNGTIILEDFWGSSKAYKINFIKK